MSVQERVRVDAELPLEPLAARLHVGGAGHCESEVALSPQREPVKLVIAQATVFVTLEVGHGCQHEAVLHGRTARKGQRLMRPHAAPP